MITLSKWIGLRRKNIMTIEKLLIWTCWQKQKIRCIKSTSTAKDGKEMRVKKLSQ